MARGAQQWDELGQEKAGTFPWRLSQLAEKEEDIEKEASRISIQDFSQRYNTAHMEKGSSSFNL
jgi:hypothetical protein